MSTVEWVEVARDVFVGGSGNEPTRDRDDVVITPPTRLVRIRQQFRLGARRLELIPLSPGHTDTDLVVHVPRR